MFFYEVSNDDIKKKELIFSIWFSLKHYKQVKQILEQHQIDLVHVHNFFPLLTPSVFKAAKDAGAKRSFIHYTIIVYGASQVIL